MIKLSIKIKKLVDKNEGDSTMKSTKNSKLEKTIKLFKTSVNSPERNSNYEAFINSEDVDYFINRVSSKNFKITCIKHMLKHF